MDDDTREWACPNCPYTVWVGYEALAAQGEPVCPECDHDMKLVEEEDDTPYSHFTPRDESGKRLKIPVHQIKVLRGDLYSRGGRGLQAVIEWKKKTYKVYSASCGLGGCMCDARLKAV